MSFLLPSLHPLVLAEQWWHVVVTLALLEEQEQRVEDIVESLAVISAATTVTLQVEVSAFLYDLIAQGVILQIPETERYALTERGQVYLATWREWQRRGAFAVTEKGRKAPGV